MPSAARSSPAGSTTWWRWAATAWPWGRSSPRRPTATTRSTTSRIDPRLGDDDDFDALIAACHERGIRVLFDGVFNHVGRAPRGSGTCSSRAGARRGGLVPTSTRRPTRPDGFGYRDVRGPRRAGRANHDEPGGARLRRRGDGPLAGPRRRRLATRRGLRRAAPFWATVLPRVRERHPDAWFVGEVIHGDYAGVRRASPDSTRSPSTSCGRRSGASLQRRATCTSWPGPSSRHDELLEHFVPLTFLGNHDVTRIASQLPDERHPGTRSRCCLPARRAERLLRRRAGAAARSRRTGPGGDDAVRPAMPGGPRRGTRGAPRGDRGLPPGAGPAPSPPLAGRRPGRGHRSDQHQRGAGRDPARGRPERPLRLVSTSATTPSRSRTARCSRPDAPSTATPSPPHAWAVVAG